MDQKLRTERRKLADLKAAEYNPRKALTPDDAEYQKIRRSIEEFGYVDPIIINEDGTIIGGHQRATVLKDLGYQEVDVVVVALDKQREKALNIALNKITGEWDEVKLKDLLLDLDLGDYDISLTGFEQNDLTELVDKLAIEPEAVDDHSHSSRKCPWSMRASSLPRQPNFRWNFSRDYTQRKQSRSRTV